MRYGIISDIHSNWEALEGVLAECRKLKVGTLLCCGDIVGYGADPKKCLEVIRKLNVTTVAGNHDWAVSGRLDSSYFTDDGKAAVMWTRGCIGLEDIMYLNGLPLELKNKDCILVHSSLKNPVHFTYVTNIAKAAEAFSVMEDRVCFIGHTHVPVIFVRHGENIYQNDGKIEIDAACQYIVNVGSVGQPRDGNPMASFCIYDTALQTIELKRVLYDVKTAQRKILEAGLPPFLSLRLARGE